jgi:hypothetical protein
MYACSRQVPKLKHIYNLETAIEPLEQIDVKINLKSMKNLNKKNTPLLSTPHNNIVHVTI